MPFSPGLQGRGEEVFYSANLASTSGTITISNLPNRNGFHIMLSGYSSGHSNPNMFYLRLNNDSGNHYSWATLRNYAGTVTHSENNADTNMVTLAFGGNNGWYCLDIHVMAKSTPGYFGITTRGHYRDSANVEFGEINQGVYFNGGTPSQISRIDLLTSEGTYDINGRLVITTEGGQS